MLGKSSFLDPHKQFDILSKGLVDVIDQKQLLEKLKELRPLRIKAGFDPSRADIHLGHSLLINKLREFQDLGHIVYFVVGDFTACIGDPSGQNKTRPLLSHKEARANAKTYIDQVTKKNLALDVSDPQMKKVSDFLKRLDSKKTKIVYNSKWLEKLSLKDFIVDICSRLTVARNLERKDFFDRYKAGKPIGLHEFFYPVLQAYDSLKIEADVELGGTDQLFNLLLGRELQKDFSKSAQCVLTLPLLLGLDGQKKMSKSLDNYISFSDSPKDVYGKVMKISDELMWSYLKVFTGEEPVKTAAKKTKDMLAWTLVASFYGQKQADISAKEFKDIFSNKKRPDNPEQANVKNGTDVWICHVLVEAGLCESTSEARRSITSGAVRWDGEKLQDFKQKLQLKTGESFLVSLGRRKFIKVVVK